MTQENNAWARALREAFSQESEDGAVIGTIKNNRSARVQYWRKPNGHITIGPTISNAPKYQQFTEIKRMRALPQSFGSEYVGEANMQPTHNGHGYSLRAVGGDVIPAWLIPFFNAGGHKYVCAEADFAFGRPGEYLMPKDQIMELGLHRLSWMREDRPDLQDVVDIPCPYGCLAINGRGPRVFSREEDKAQHIVAVHSDAVPAQAMSQAIGEAIKARDGGSQSASSLSLKEIAMVVAATLQSMGLGNAKTPDDLVKDIQKYPDGAPDSTWNRKELMSYASSHGLYPPAHLQKEVMRWTKEQWLNYLTRSHEFEGVEVPQEPNYGVGDLSEKIEEAFGPALAT